MKTEQKSPSAISEAALKVFSRQELEQMPRPQRLSLMHLIAKRLDKQPAPTLEELQGIAELVVDHLSHPALGALSKELPTSPTTSSSTSASPQPTEPQSSEPSVDQQPPVAMS